MEPRERIENHEEVYRLHGDAHSRSKWSAIPGIVSADSDGQTLSVQPAIKGQITKSDGKVEHVDLPLLQDVPIHYAGGGGMTLTHPIKKGDECLIILSSRPIDTWFQSGGTQKAIDMRNHHLSDGMAIPGFRSQPRALKNISTTNTQLRTDDGETIVEMEPSNHVSVRPHRSDPSKKIWLGALHNDPGIIWGTVLTSAGPAKNTMARV